MSNYGSSAADLNRARSVVDDLFGIVQPDSLYERPIPLRHRIVFYLGHVEAFDSNLISGHVPEVSSSSPELDRLFAFGIDPENGSEPRDRPEDWPELGRIRQYCEKARESVDQVWDAVPGHLRHAAIEHRLMHAETLAYMLHEMCPERLVAPGAAEDVPAGNGRRNEPVRIPAGTATLGATPGNGFGWDNEFPEMRARAETFEIDRFKVRNRDYLEFVEAGGTPSHFWTRRNGEWYLRRMFDRIPLPADWPVWVTHEQASAYAAWRGCELPTEVQWHRAAYGTPDGLERRYPWGEADPASVKGNFSFRRWDPAPSDDYEGTVSAFGVEDLMGNGWEWTSSLFRAFPGFEPFPFYPGYSAAFFDGDHYVLKGASPRTDAVFLRRSFRNWFRSGYPWVFATFRCVHNRH